MELSQNKGELDRRLQEKEEEMDAARYLVLLNLRSLPDPPRTAALSVAHMVSLLYALLLGLINIWLMTLSRKSSPR